MTFIAERDLVSFRAGLTGSAVVEGDPGYDEARSVWNGEIDHRPAVVALVADPADVVTALAFARDRRLDVSVRGGGHNPGGTARCGGGATLAQLDAATQEHGLAVPAGTVSHTGVGGLTLGGGFGWLTAKHGLTIDNLVSAEVVTADGRVLRASATEEPDLFWALRGGGGNFGVVTEFEFALHPVGPLVDVGLFFWPLTQGTEALKLVRNVIEKLDDGLSAMLVGRNAPPAPFVSQEHRFAPGYALVVAGFGDTDGHARIARYIRDSVPPLFDLVSPLPYTALQQLIDDATAFGGPRRASLAFGMTAIASSPELLEADRAWVRSFWNALLPHAANSGSYVNFMADCEEDRVRASYGKAKYDRLAAIKDGYDPENVFRHNANIRPTLR